MSTGLRVSAVGFGTCQLRLVPEEQALATLNDPQFVEAARKLANLEQRDVELARRLRDSTLALFGCRLQPLTQEVA